MPRILAVDDEDDYRFLFHEILRREGFEVFGAASGEQAWKTLQENPVDLIILDWVLPGGGAESFCLALRADRRFSRIPVLLCTVSKDPGALEDAYSCGVNRHIFKPFGPSDLVYEVQALLQRKRNGGQAK